MLLFLRCYQRFFHQLRFFANLEKLKFFVYTKIIMRQCKIQKKSFVKIMLISKNIFTATYALQEFLNYITIEYLVS